MFAKLVGFATVVILATVLLLPASGTAEDAQPLAQATVVKQVVKRPARVVRRVYKFRSPSRPTPGQVIHVINREAAMWGVSGASLSRRVACESHFEWWASNGQYEGVLQFAPGTFYRGLRTIRTHRIVERVVRFRRMHSRVYRYWSTGQVTRSRGRVIRQKVVVVRRGHIPRNPSVVNVDAQVRIGAQALRGISAVHSSEWSCAA